MSVTEELAVDSEQHRVEEAVAALLSSHDPRSTDERTFLEAQFDAGLAWVHFPVGHGGLGLSPKVQRIVMARSLLTR